jgi:hypothetical protein
MYCFVHLNVLTLHDLMVSILDCADCTVLGMKSPFLELEGLFVNET